MAIKATIEVDQTTVSIQDAVWCTVRLENSTRSSIVGLNPNNGTSLPTILLTNVTSGDTSRHAVAPRDGAVESSESVLPGNSFERRKPLLNFFRWPGPGKYQLRAQFTWLGNGGGGATSDPVSIEVSPSHPRTLSVMPSRGGTSGLYCAAWTQEVEPGKNQYEVWYGQIDPDRRPKFTDCVKLADVKSAVQPFVSVPPNDTPSIQWIAWTCDGRIHFVPHRYGQVCEPESLPIPSEHAWIVPPLLVHTARRGEQLSGAIALLYEPNEQGNGGRFIKTMLQLAAKGGTTEPETVELPGLRVDWAATAYLSTLRRQTFIAARGENGECLLKVSTWSALKPPSSPIDLAVWESRFVAGHVMVTRGDFARGVILAEKPDGGASRYSLYQWAYTENGEFMSADPIAISWPRREGISHAVIRISEPGAAYALMRADDKDGSWFFCNFGGRVKAMPKTLRPPVDILFRYGDDPTILHADAGKGLLFMRP